MRHPPHQLPLFLADHPPAGDALRTRRGEPLADIVGRLLANINITAGGCWEWTGARTGAGYGALKVGKRVVTVHRLAAEYLAGLDIRGRDVRHTCDNPPCINPAHLLAGSRADNNRDKVERGRQARGERNGAARLSEEQVREIIALEGLPQKVIAARFGVTASAVRQILRGRNWRHVTGRRSESPRC